MTERDPPRGALELGDDDGSELELESQRTRPTPGGGGGRSSPFTGKQRAERALELDLSEDAGDLELDTAGETVTSSEVQYEAATTGMKRREPRAEPRPDHMVPGEHDPTAPRRARGKFMELDFTADGPAGGLEEDAPLELDLPAKPVRASGGTGDLPAPPPIAQGRPGELPKLSARTAAGPFAGPGTGSMGARPAGRPADLGLDARPPSARAQGSPGPDPRAEGARALGSDLGLDPRAPGARALGSDPARDPRAQGARVLGSDLGLDPRAPGARALGSDPARDPRAQGARPLGSDLGLDPRAPGARALGSDLGLDPRAPGARPLGSDPARDPRAQAARPLGSDLGLDPRAPGARPLGSDLGLDPRAPGARPLGSDQTHDPRAQGARAPDPSAHSPMASDLGMPALPAAKPLELDLSSLDEPAEAPLELAREAPPPPVHEARPPPVVTSDLDVAAIGPEHRCPKCAHVQPSGHATCLKCGVIFAKVHAVPVAGARPLSDPGGPPPAAARPVSAPGGAPPIPIVLGTPSEAAPPAREPERPRATSGPRLPLEVKTAPVLARSPRPSVSITGQLGDAFVSPFLGVGVLWLPLIAMFMLLGLILGGALRITALSVMMALIAGYFARSFANGYGGERRAPDLPRVNNFKDEFLYPGLAFIGLCIVLFAFPAIQAGRIMIGVAADFMTAAADAAGSDELEARMEGLNPDEVFLDEKGSIVVPKEGDEGRRLKRADGHWVRVYYDDGVIVYEDPIAEATGGRATSAAADMLGDGTTREVDRMPVPKVPVSSIILLVFALLIPFVYWPMALAIASTGDNVLAIFNPARVVGAATRAGVPYVMVVGIGIGIVAVPVLLIANAGSLERVAMFAALLLGSMGYAAAVQGYLLGAIAARDPDLFPGFKG